MMLAALDLVLWSAGVMLALGVVASVVGGVVLVVLARWAWHRF